MYFNLAKRNMKRSIKDYAIYFITLIFSISLFYAFNTISDQKVLLNLDETWASAFNTISIFMNVSSVFVVFVLAFLIIYSNNFLIRRRKKELGIYLTLGMENRGVSKILFIETLILGTVSLALGLIAGVFVSQILSIFTANLFEVEMTGFAFILSKNACIKTVIAFGGIYALVALLNVSSINRIKLINLINANKKNQNIKVKNPLLSFFIFLISLGIIIAAYSIVLDEGVAVLSSKTIIAIVLGCIGTFIFFMSLSGFLLTVLKRSENIYLKNLNIFLIRQINSKINTAFVSVSFICLLLFMAICMLSSGMSLNVAMNKNIVDLTPYNVTLYSYSSQNIPEILKKNNIDINNYTDSYDFITTYTGDIHYSNLFTKEIMQKNTALYPISRDTNVEFIKISDLNKELENLGREEIELGKDEFIIISDIDCIIDGMKESYTDSKTIKVNNKEYRIYKKPVLEFTFYNAVIKGTIGTVAIEDSAVEKMNALNTYMNFNYRDKSLDNEFMNSVKSLNLGYENLSTASEREIINTTKGTGASVSFLGIYLGIIFIIASSAVLAIRQLSSTDDNLERYNLLKKIGTDEEEIFKTVKAEIGIYFGMPLILAIIHSVVGLKLANDVIDVLGNGSSIIKLMTVSCIFIVIIYGTYYLGTYICAKSIIRKKS